MGKALRMVDVPAWYREVHVRQPGDPWSSREYFKGRDLALADVRGFPPVEILERVNGVVELDGKRYEHDAATFGNRCAIHYGMQAGYPDGFHPGWWIMKAQKEQRLLMVKRPTMLQPEVDLVEERDHDTPAAEMPAGCFDVRTRGFVDAAGVKQNRWRVYRGEYRMAFACGYGAPDSGAEPAGDIARYAGFWRQQEGAYRGLASYLRQWREGRRTVPLYADDDEVARAIAENRRPRGEIVVCANEITLALLLYTPITVKADGSALRAAWVDHRGRPADVLSDVTGCPAIWKDQGLPC